MIADYRYRSSGVFIGVAERIFALIYHVILELFYIVLDIIFCIFCLVYPLFKFCKAFAETSCHIRQSFAKKQQRHDKNDEPINALRRPYSLNGCIYHIYLLLFFFHYTRKCFSGQCLWFFYKKVSG